MRSILGSVKFPFQNTTLILLARSGARDSRAEDKKGLLPGLAPSAPRSVTARIYHGRLGWPLKQGKALDNYQAHDLRFVWKYRIL